MPAFCLLHNSSLFLPFFHSHTTLYLKVMPPVTHCCGTLNAAPKAENCVLDLFAEVFSKAQLKLLKNQIYYKWCPGHIAVAHMQFGKLHWICFLRSCSTSSWSLLKSNSYYLLTPWKRVLAWVIHYWRPTVVTQNGSVWWWTCGASSVCLLKHVAVANTSRYADKGMHIMR